LYSKHKIAHDPSRQQSNLENWYKSQANLKLFPYQHRKHGLGTFCAKTPSTASLSLEVTTIRKPNNVPVN
jgi:hypothetical protein